MSLLLSPESILLSRVREVLAANSGIAGAVTGRISTVEYADLLSELTLSAPALVLTHVGSRTSADLQRQTTRLAVGILTNVRGLDASTFRLDLAWTIRRAVSRACDPATPEDEQIIRPVDRLPFEPETWAYALLNWEDQVAARRLKDQVHVLHLVGLAIDHRLTRGDRV